MAVESFIPPIDETDKHNSYAMYMGGFEAEDIVRELGVKMNTLRAWITRDGWYNTRESIKAQRNKKNPPQESAMMKMFSPEKAETNIKKFKEVSGEMAVEDIKHWKDMSPEERLVVAPAITGLNSMHRKNLEMDREEEGSKSAINITFLNNPEAVTLLPSSDVKEIEQND